MQDGSSFASGTTSLRVCEAGYQVGRWEAIEPFASSGTWEGRVQLTDDVCTQVDLCGHLHDSQPEASHCAQRLAARLNAGSTAPGYLGDPTVTAAVCQRPRPPASSELRAAPGAHLTMNVSAAGLNEVPKVG